MPRVLGILLCCILGILLCSRTARSSCYTSFCAQKHSSMSSRCPFSSAWLVSTGKLSVHHIPSSHVGPAQPSAHTAPVPSAACEPHTRLRYFGAVYVTKLRPPDHYICQHSLSEGRLQCLGCTADRERVVAWSGAAPHINCDGRKQPGPKPQYE